MTLASSSSSFYPGTAPGSGSNGLLYRVWPSMSTLIGVPPLHANDVGYPVLCYPACLPGVAQVRSDPGSWAEKETRKISLHKKRGSIHVLGLGCCAQDDHLTLLWPVRSMSLGNGR